jgi:hypothetical protein
MEISLLKTLASKYKTSALRVQKKYKAELVVDGKKYLGLQVSLPRQDKKPLIATWGAIPLVWDIKATLEDKIPTFYPGRAELVQRLLANCCEYCGSTEELEAHHVRAMTRQHIELTEVKALQKKAKTLLLESRMQ